MDHTVDWAFLGPLYGGEICQSMNAFYKNIIPLETFFFYVLL